MQKEVKRLLVLGTVLLVVGTVSFLWVFTDQKKQQQRLSQQHELYNTKITGISELADVQGEMHAFKGAISDAISSEKPENISENKTTKRISYISTVCLSLGTVIFLSLILLRIVHFILEKISNFKENLAQLREKQKEADDLLIESNPQQRQREAKLTHSLYEPAKFDANAPCTDLRKFHLPKPAEEKPTNMIRPDQDNKFFTDKPDHLEEKIRDAIMSSYQENALKAQDSFKQQAEKLEKQVAEIKNITESITQAKANGDKPSGNNIGELTEQIAAIRDYASSQQERVTKLQEGYDWNIVRTFCLRIIRCIDNIDSRIEAISQQGGDTSDLEDIKDDFVFALESSGVEQFEPDVNSNYTGSQKIAEAVKERKCCDESEMKGKIAEIIKPGYRYVIDEDNTKVVRIAQVKLFG